MPTWLVFANPAWIPWVIAGAIALTTIAILQYRNRLRSRLSLFAMFFKLLGAGLLLLCLLDPMASRQRPRPQANVFGIVVDNSQSMLVTGATAEQQLNRLQSTLDEKAEWQRRLAQDFVLRRYAFADALSAEENLASLPFAGSSSALHTSMQTLAQRFEDRPVAGVLLFSDGNSTDLASEANRLKAWKDMGFPVYPVLTAGQHDFQDISLGLLVVNQSDFEAAPVTIRVPVFSRGLAGEKARVQILDSSGKSVQSQDIYLPKDGTAKLCEFRFRPEESGAAVYRAVVALTNELEMISNSKTEREATAGNNSRFQIVDRGRGPYRILYVAGRPNWEHKFLKRALDEDDEIRLVSLVRIAKKEPKFSFRDSRADASNPLFSGFEDIDDEDKERFDEAVFVRQGVADGEQLSKGFPKSASELFAYECIILDDIEDNALTQEQLTLLRQYVSVRGGGLLFLGGQESLRGKAFETSALGEMAPVYADRGSSTSPDADAKYQLSLTREGWLLPFMRLSDNEEGERKRLAAMPPFEVLNAVNDVKPGASILAEASQAGKKNVPALVTQRFGKGRTSALLVGDMWRWAMHQEPDSKATLQQSWRQMVRWMIADVPRRLDFESLDQSQDRVVTFRLNVRGEDYKPLDRAVVEMSLTTPSGKSQLVTVEPSAKESGQYEFKFLPTEEGAYKVKANVSEADGNSIGNVESGWVNHRLANEFQQLGEQREHLQEIASQTGGELVEMEDLDRFVTSLQSKKVPVTETWLQPLWHQPWVLLLALFCFCSEWALRRWNGLP